MKVELWFILALGAAFAIQPAYVSIPLCWKRFNMRPTTFSAFYFAGTAAGVILFLLMQRGWAFVPGPTAFIIVSIGLICGAPAYSLYFEGLPRASNPGCPAAVFSTFGIMVFIISYLLTTIDSAYFGEVGFNLRDLAGLILGVLALLLIAHTRLEKISELKSEPWVGKAIAGMICFVPVPISIQILNRHYGIEPIVFCSFFFIGVSLGTFAYLVWMRRSKEIMNGRGGRWAATTGFLFGSITNTLFFIAVVLSKNPGKPATLYTLAGCILYLGSLMAKRILPDVFGHVRFNPISMTGVGLVPIASYLLQW